MKVVGSKQSKFYNATETKDLVLSLINVPVRVNVKSRGKETCDDGVITAAYGSIFIFEYTRGDNSFKSAYSYVDLFTGTVTITQIGKIQRPQ